MLKVLKFFITFVALTSGLISEADDSMVQVGAGMTSLTSGRQIPALQVGYETSSWAATFGSTGYQTRYDYLSGYIACGYYAFDVGTLLGMRTRGGFGVGTYYTKRGYRDAIDQPLNEDSDLGIGAAFRVGVYPFDFMFLRIETLLALGSTYNILLVYQDVAQLTLGVYF